MGHSKVLCGIGLRTRLVKVTPSGTAARTSLPASRRWIWTHLGVKAAAVDAQVETEPASVPAHLTVQAEDRADRARTLVVVAAVAARATLAAASLTVQVGGAQDLALGRVVPLTA